MECKTTLYDTHVKYGGKMVPFAGFLLPVQYGTGVIAVSYTHLHREPGGGKGDRSLCGYERPRNRSGRNCGRQRKRE